MKTIILSLTILASFAQAETTTYTIKGMHCSGCKEMITLNVCENKEIQASTESCTVKVVDEDKEIGQIRMVTKKGKKIDSTLVETGVKAAGEKYEITNKVTK